MSEVVNKTQDLDGSLRELAAAMDAVYEQAVRHKQTLEQQRLMEVDREDRSQRLLRIDRERQRLDRDVLSQARDASSQVQSVGGLIATLVQGRLMPALQSFAGLLQGVAERKARAAEPAARGEARKAQAPGERERDKPEAPETPATPAIVGTPAPEQGEKIVHVTTDDRVVRVKLNEDSQTAAPSMPEPYEIQTETYGLKPEAPAAKQQPAVPEIQAGKVKTDAAVPAATGGGEAGGSALSGIAGGVTIAVAAVAAFVAVIGAAVSALISMSKAATPQAWSTLNDALGVVSATIGGLLTPFLFRFGQAVTFIGDLLYEAAPQFIRAFEDTAASLGQTVKLVYETMIPWLKPLDLAITWLANAFMKSAERMLTAAEYVLSYVSKKAAAKAAEGRDQAREKLRNAEGKTPLSVLADKIDRMIKEVGEKTKVGGKTLSERWGEAGKEFAAATMQKIGGTARFEATADSYKRIQQAAVGQTSYEQKMLQIAFDNANAMARVAYNTDKLATREGPLR